MSYSNILTTTELEITEAAQTKMCNIIANADTSPAGIRIYMTGGGCSGLTYGMTFADSTGELDKTMQFNDCNVYVDVVALSYLYGAQVDYVSDVGMERFVFNNMFSSTNGSGSCGGCGSAQ